MDEDVRKLLTEIAAHLKRHTVWIDDDSVDYPGYPTQQEAEARSLYRRINERLAAE